MHLNSLSLFVDPSQGSFANVLYTFRAGAITAAASPERDLTALASLARDLMDQASPERDHMDQASPERDLTADGEPFVDLTWNKKSAHSGAAGMMMTAAAALASLESPAPASPERAHHLTHAHVVHLESPERDHRASLERAPTIHGAPLAPVSLERDHPASPVREARASHPRDLRHHHQKTPTSSRPTTHTTTMKTVQVDLESLARDHMVQASPERDHMDPASPERDHMDLASPERDHMVAGANGGKFIMSSIVHHHSYAR